MSIHKLLRIFQVYLCQPLVLDLVGHLFAFATNELAMCEDITGHRSVHGVVGRVILLALAL